MPQLICFKCPWAIAIEAAGVATAIQMFAGGGLPVTLPFVIAISASTYVGYQVFNTTGDPLITTIISAAAYYGGAYYADVPLSWGHLLMFTGIIAAWNFYLEKYLKVYVNRAYNDYNAVIEDARNFVHEL